MKEFKYVITDPQGIHARPAGELVKAVKPFASSIKIVKDGKEGDCRKIFGNYYNKGNGLWDVTYARYGKKLPEILNDCHCCGGFV